MKPDQDAGTLISTHTSGDWVSIAVTKKLAIYQGIFPCIPLNCVHPSLCGVDLQNLKKLIPLEPIGS